MNYTIPFSKLNKTDIPVAGGKGANLGELSSAGFPVPPGFVLTTDAYDTFVETHDFQRQIIDLVQTVSADDPQSCAVVSENIKQLFLHADVPRDIVEALMAMKDSLDETAVAVRSSATVEDLPETSFAGQHDTCLNIQGEEALLAAVKNCWASLWSARAIAYRIRQDIDPTMVSMAVVVQQFIPADSAGVLFTADPVDGDRKQIVLNATWGLGEAIVSGQVTPDTVVVDKLNWQIVSRKTAPKRVMTVQTENGSAEQPVPQAKQNQPVLIDETAVTLAKLGTNIEAHYGMPMDIEWAIAGSEIAILQARPITSLPPAPLTDVRWEPPRPGTIWMRRQIVEHMPEPLSPLFAELYVHEGIGQSVDEMAEFMSDLSGMELNPWDFVDPPFATTINGYAYSVASFKFSWQLIPLAIRVYVTVLPKMLRHLIPRWRDYALPAYQAKIAHWGDINLSKASDETLLQGIRELTYEDIVYWFAASVPLGMARVTDEVLDRFLKFVAGGSQMRSGSFLRGFPSKTVEAQARLEAIAKKIQASESLREEVISTPPSRLLDILREQPDIRADLTQYLTAYGHQIYNLDFAVPTLADNPLPVLLSLKTAVTHPERDVWVKQSAFAKEREALTAQMKRSLNPILRPIFNLLLGWAQRYTPNRELALFYVGAAWPALRRLALELGQRLTAAGNLNNPEDVFYLKSAELAQASTARAAGVSRPDLAQLAHDRRLLRQARMRLDPPVVVPPGGRLKFGPIDMAMFEPKPRTVSTGPTLDGFAVSPGTVTAPASVIHSPADFDKMQPDTILVCTTTTPAWTPLFGQAKGLVTDIGGALAHGSIVAREYGIPAVMGTGNATHRIKSGQMIRVDGNTGTVILIDEVDTRAETRIQAEQLSAKRPIIKRKGVVLGLVTAVIVVLVLWWKNAGKKSR